MNRPTGIHKILAAITEETGEENHGVMLAFVAPGGPDCHMKATALLERAMEAMPPGLIPEPVGDQIAMHVSVNHDADCPAQEHRDMTKCTCEEVMVEVVFLSPFETAVIEGMGEYDHIQELDGRVVKSPEGDIIQFDHPEEDEETN